MCPIVVFFEVVLPAVQISEEGLGQIISEEGAGTFFTFYNTLKIVLGLGVVLSLLRFFVGFSKIIELKKTAKRGQIFGIPVLFTSEIKTPFSFFNNLFWSTQLNHLSEEEQRQMVLHESAHIKKLHSFDVMFFELVTVVFWWNPLTYAYKISLREIHEFQADAYAIGQTNNRQYGRLLISLSQSFSALLPLRSQPTLANHFFHSQLKKRIMMMTKKKSSGALRFKYLLILPVLLTVIFACETVVQNELPEIDETTKAKIAEDDNILKYVTDTIITFDPETKEETIETVETPIYKVAERMPRFPGCEDEPGGEEAVRKCSNQKLMENIFTNLKYPKEAKDNGVEGMVVISFVVGRFNGSILEPEIVKSLSPECDAEVMRVVKNMPPWIPGEHDGKKVDVKYHLPVKFKLE